MVRTILRSNSVAHLLVGVLIFVPVQLFAQLDPLESKSTEVGGIVFRHPEAVQVTTAAKFPLVQWPIVADWDDQGCLVIVESAGVRQSVEEQRKSRPHRMIRLADTDGDGVFDQRLVAADNLAFPEGVLCIGNQVLVSMPPEIWSFTDDDNDGVCEKREVWFDGKTLTYCANDLHGPYMGRDGWIYWCKGAFAEQKHQLINGKTLTTKASHIFRRKLTGGPIEPVMSGGMDNPVEVAITPEGERFFTSTFLQHPGGGMRDGIAHAVYGGVYGKDHNVIEGHPRTGTLMPIMTQLGPAAPSGLLSLRSNAIPSDLKRFPGIKNFLVAAQFNLQKVSLHGLTENGATYSTHDCDLLVGDRIDFHPTDVIEDADGSLLVIDTGGWYDLCCPSSGIDQERALGGIYRIRSATTDGVVDPRGTLIIGDVNSKIDPITHLEDSRWWVRKKALDQAVALGDGAIDSLTQVMQNNAVDEAIRQEALWGLCRVGTENSVKAIQHALDNPNPNIRQTAIHALSVNRKGDASRLEKMLNEDASPHVRRVAAESLGRLSDPSAIDSLLQAIARENNDRVMEHSILFALIELRKPELMREKLEKAPLEIQWACLEVLSQIAPDSLDAKSLFGKAKSADPRLRSSAIALLAKSPAWASDLKAELESCWKDSPQIAIDRQLLVAVCRAWKDRPEVVDLLQAPLQANERLSEQQLVILIELLTQLDGIVFPDAWAGAVCSLTRKVGGERQLQLANWLAKCKLSENSSVQIANTLVDIAGQPGQSKSQAFTLIRALPRSEYLSEPLCTAIIRDFVSADSEQAKGLAAQALAKARLTGAQAESLSEQLSQIDPIRLQDAVAAICRAGDDDVDANTLNQLCSMASARTLNAESVASLYKNRSPELQVLAKRTTDALARPPEQIEKTLSSWENELPDGDPIAGFQVFRGSKAACSACHKIGYVGGTVGPDLTRIGATRTKRDLLEAILFPSARFAQSYHPVRILTVDGQIYNGLVTNENAKEIELLIAAEKYVRIPMNEIEDRKISTVSVMPAGLEEALGKKDIADLIALLQASK